MSYQYYKTAFCTLDDVVTQYNLAVSPATNVSATKQAVITAMDTVQRILMKQLIFDASDEIMTEWHRSFVPFLATYTVKARSHAWRNSWSHCNGNYVFNLLRLPYADLLSLSEVTLNDEVISASSYELSPSDTYPAWQVSFDGDNVSLPTGTAFSTALELTGTWGYHENPGAMWSNIGTLQANISDSATSFVATAGTVGDFETYQYLQIESEILFVTAVLSTAPYTITVERGARGSTAAAHLSTTAIKAYKQMPVVIKATRRRVINLMQKKAELANLVQIGEGVAEASTERIDLKLDKRLIWGSP
jgi:hypothetical protein